MHQDGCPQWRFLSAVSTLRVVAVCTKSRPTFLYRHCVHVPSPRSDHPGALSSLGSCVATTTGRRRRGVATWGVQSAGQQARTRRRASRALSASLGPPVEHVGGESHTPTAKHRAVSSKCRSASSLAHWPPHSEGRSDHIGRVGTLRSPSRVEVSVMGSQPHQPHTAVASVRKRRAHKFTTTKLL